MKNQWYGVYAINGLGIYTNYQKFLKDKSYMRSEHIKKFTDQEEAEDFAMNGFLDLNSLDHLPDSLSNYDYLRINYFYFHNCK